MEFATINGPNNLTPYEQQNNEITATNVVGETGDYETGDYETGDYGMVPAVAPSTVPVVAPVMSGPIGTYEHSRSPRLFEFGRKDSGIGGCIEAFGHRVSNRTLLKWMLIGLLVYLILELITNSQRKPVDCRMFLAQTGGNYSVSELDFDL